jgi:hypothetical protein
VWLTSIPRVQTRIIFVMQLCCVQFRDDVVARPPRVHAHTSVFRLLSFFSLSLTYVIFFFDISFDTHRTVIQASPLSSLAATASQYRYRTRGISKTPHRWTHCGVFLERLRRNSVLSVYVHVFCLTSSRAARFRKKKKTLSPQTQTICLKTYSRDTKFMRFFRFIIILLLLLLLIIILGTVCCRGGGGGRR